jgi:glyoxylase-like metal-dependent hydrolase (beta-lactamase superfamily II)
MEILPGVHRIAGPASAAYLLDGGAALTVVDTGVARFDRTILRYLVTINRQPDDVERIILTHRHFDHIGGSAALRQATGARTLAHPRDIPQIDGSERNRPPKGMLGIMMGAVAPVLFPLVPCPVDDPLADGQTIPVGALGELQVLYTPGHTMGHCSLLLPSRSLFILGDALNHFGPAVTVSFEAVNDDTPLARKTALAIADIPAENLVFGHGAPILGNGPAMLKDAAARAQHG